jgi:hypothetical protein
VEAEGELGEPENQEELLVEGEGAKAMTNKIRVDIYIYSYSICKT